MPNEPESALAVWHSLWDIIVLGGFAILYIGGGTLIALGLIWLNRRMPWGKQV